MVATTHPKRRRVIPAVVAVVAVVFSLLVASPAQAADEPFAFTGQVQVERVGPATEGQFEVAARRNGQTEILGTALTGPDGRFSITGLTYRGTYTLTATPVDDPGLYPISRTVTAFGSDVTRDAGTFVSVHRRTFSGSVVTPEGGSIPDGTTSVTVRNPSTGWSASSPVVDGRFSFSGLDPVTHQIEIDYEGTSGFYDLPATSVSGFTTDNVVNRIFKLSRGASVNFRLNGEASQPAPSDTVVTLYKWAGTGWAQVEYSEITVPPGQLGSDGELMFLNLGPGDYLAHVAPPNATQPSFWIQPSNANPWPSYQYSERDLSVRGTPSFQITSAYANILTVTRSVRASRTLSGTVLLPGGAPAANGVVRVTLSGPSDQGTRDLATALLDDGTFSFSGLVPWTYQLRVDYLPDESTIDTTTSFALSSSPQASPATITLVHSYTISGTVSLGDASRTAPEGSPVQITGRNRSWTLTTDANGRFRLTGLTAGTYVVAVHDVGDASWDRVDTQVVLAGNVDADLDIVFELRRAFEGRVTNSSGTPLRGIQVFAYLYDPTTGQYESEMSTTTDSAGRYSFTPDNFDVELYFFDPSGVYATEGWEDVNPYYVPDLLVLPANTRTTGIDAQLDKAGRLTGTITTPGYTSRDRQYVGVEVMVYDYDSDKWVGTGDYYGLTSQGTFSIPDIYPDDYRIQAFYATYDGAMFSRSGVVTVEAGKSRSVGTIRLGTRAPTTISPAASNGDPAIGTYWFADRGVVDAVPAATYQYQWLRCSTPVAAGFTKVPPGCTLISGATRDDYRSKKADAGSYLTIMVTAKNVAGSIRSVGATTIRVDMLPGAPTVTGAPTVNGSTRVGSTWTLSPGTYAGTPTPTVKQAWYRCTAPIATVVDEVPAGCVAISGATGTRYTSTRSDFGKYLTAVVTTTNSNGSIRTTSASTVRTG